MIKKYTFTVNSYSVAEHLFIHLDSASYLAVSQRVGKYKYTERTRFECRREVCKLGGEV